MTDPMAAQTAGAQSVPGTDGPISVPSGQPLTLMDVIWNERGPEGLTFRFRFLAPQIARQGGTVDYETAAVDMLHLLLMDFFVCHESDWQKESVEQTRPMDHYSRRRRRR